MLTDRHFPYSSMQEINLDWILTKVKNILRFVPDDGRVGQILRRTAHGAEWSDEQGGGGGAVNSVNGQTGDVVLDASDVGALPDTTVIPTDTSDLTNSAGFVDAAGAAAAAPVQSVNGQTGAVSLSIPTDTSDLNNDSGFVDAAGAAAAAPVQSVNGQTGAVSLSIPTDTSDLNNDSGFVDAAGAAAAAPVQSVNGQTGAVVITSSSWTTIWTNTSPNADFTNQTILHDLSGYTEFSIRFVAVKSATPDTSDNFEFIYSSKDVVFFATGWSGALARGRTIKISNTGVLFGSGTYLTAYSSGSWTTANHIFIPLSIKAR